MGYGAIVISIILFIIIWGVWGWQETKLFYEAWWFDALGHAITGFGGALALRYLFKKHHRAKDIFEFSFGRPLLSALVEKWIMRCAFTWEIIEFCWDEWGQPWLSWLAQAQKGSADTMIDLIITIGAGYGALIFVRWREARYDKRHPEDTEKREVQEALFILERASELKHIRKQARRQKYIRRVISFFQRDLKITARTPRGHD